VQGYFQPVLIKGPAGVTVSLAEGAAFTQPETAPLRASLLVGQVYRFRVMNIPLNPGAEVFPSVELIDRIYPPAGQEQRFPIVVELSHDDIMTALQGKFVTKVIYLEDPNLALPALHPGGEQPSFDVAPGRDPLAVADFTGRPVAILRLGAILPPQDGSADGSFFFGSPPWTRPTAAPPTAPVIPATPPVPAPRVETASR